MSLYGIKIKGDKDHPDHESETRKVIEKVAQNPVGKAVLELIAKESEDLTIVPYLGGDKCNAQTVPTAERHFAPKGVKPHKGLGDWNGTPNHDERDEQFSYTGTGEGANVKMHFTAGLLGGADCHHGHFGESADSTLVHELVHALRMMQGIYNPVPTQGVLKPYTNEEEYLAVAVANVYISASGSTLLRADYEGNTQLAAHLCNSAGFLAVKEHRELLSMYFAMWDKIFHAVGNVSAIYNPFGELLNRTNFLRRPNPKPKPSQPALPLGPFTYRPPM